MKNFLKKQKEAIVLISYPLLVAALVYFGIMPILNRINNINEQIQEENLQQESAKKHLDELPKIEEQYSELKKSEDLINVLLDNNSAVVLIERLEKLAEDSGNKISIVIQDKDVSKKAVNNSVSLKTAKSDEKTLVDSLPDKNYLQMKITLVGNYNEIMSFIYSLERFEYYSDIIGIQLTNDNNGKIENKSSSVSVGISNPFSGSSGVQNGEPELKKEGDLSGVVDVVFYNNN